MGQYRRHAPVQSYVDIPIRPVLCIYSTTCNIGTDTSANWVQIANFAKCKTEPSPDVVIH